MICRSSSTLRNAKSMNSKTIENVIERLMWRLENFLTTSTALIRKKVPKKGGSKI